MNTSWLVNLLVPRSADLLVPGSIVCYLLQESVKSLSWKDPWKWFTYWIVQYFWRVPLGDSCYCFIVRVTPSVNWKGRLFTMWKWCAFKNATNSASATLFAFRFYLRLNPLRISSVLCRIVQRLTCEWIKTVSGTQFVLRISGSDSVHFIQPKDLFFWTNHLNESPRQKNHHYSLPNLTNSTLERSIKHE